MHLLKILWLAKPCKPFTGALVVCMHIIQHHDTHVVSLLNVFDPRQSDNLQLQVKKIQLSCTSQKPRQPDAYFVHWDGQGGGMEKKLIKIRQLYLSIIAQL